MIKKLHLVCNAHLDPVWQWEWEEGAAEALSTFRIAASFCEEFDSFVFCHNEALLYKWIEEYDPMLFEKIRDLVKRGKWHIMGGWHLQPDCNMPSGEFFVRQIFSGRKYFKEKFGVVPKIAFNADPFGHTRGLVQIMKKTGYEGYLFMRPSDSFMSLPHHNFKWVGYDGSEIMASKICYGYNSGKGKAVEKISRILNEVDDEEFYLCLWGIGNHGGGPSKKDLVDISEIIKTEKEKGIEIIHSTPESYFDELKNTDLPKVEKSLNLWAPGCYTSQVRIKQRYRQAENEYFFAESICSHASMSGLMEYPDKELAEALYDIITVQFHDILPGSSIQPAEEMALRMLDHALEILSRVKTKAFFALSGGQRKPDEDKIPIFVYNPYPYELKGDFTAEFMLWDQVRDLIYMSPNIFDENGRLLKSQCEKEYSSLPMEWRKRVVFNATLEPMKLNRFDCGFTVLDKKPKYELETDGNCFVYDNNGLKVKINKKTGLIELIEKNGVEYVNTPAFSLEVYKDNHDPWYMEDIGWRDVISNFTLLTPEEVKAYYCVKEAIEPVRVIESGDVRCVIEAAFGYKSSRAVVKYIISHNGDFNVDVRINWNEKQELVKLNIPASFNVCDCIGEHAYGRENLKTDLTENVSQKYISLCGTDKGITVANNGIYGSSFDGNKNTLKLTLLRSPSYCAHPVDDRIVLPQDKFSPHIEQGERDYSFKLDFGDRASILNSASRFAQHFNVKPMALSFYPSGIGNKPQAPVLIINNDIINIAAFKKAEIGDGYIVRLFNPVEAEQKATLKVENSEYDIRLGAFEIKTFRYSNGNITETDLLENLLN